METTNLSKIRRDKMLNTINEIKKNITDEETLTNLSMIENELTKKKYGLIWEEHEERVDKELETKIPTFEEVKDKEIVSNPEDKFNFLLEGDNLHSLYLLEKTYKGLIDVIYIDPPYNTKNKDFIYNDQIIGLEDSYRHSKWLSFMSKRLSIAKNLLSENGVIFISIDDNEMAQLKLLCDDIFGENSFVSQLVWEKKKKGSFLSNQITNIKEYILVYCKNEKNFGGLIGQINYCTETYPCINASNKRQKRKISKGIKSNFKEKNYIVKAGTIISDSTMDIKYITDLVIQDGIVKEDFIVEGNWRYSDEAMWQYSINKELYITNALYIRRIVSEPRVKNLKDLLPRVGDNSILGYDSKINPNNLFENGWGSNEDADNEVIDFFGKKRIFNYPKPCKLIKKIICSTNNKNAIICDFFAGTGTTAQAVLELNKEDGGNRQFILCTNNENNICEDITYQRIKTVITGKRKDGSKYSEGIKANLKYYKCTYIPRINTEDENLHNNLLINIKNLIQLENGIEIDDNKIRVYLDEDELDRFSKDQSELDVCEKAYISSDILLTSMQETIFKNNNIEIYIIPEYYFEDEIMEVM